jgi:hypothetical protein
MPAEAVQRAGFRLMDVRDFQNQWTGGPGCEPINAAIMERLPKAKATAAPGLAASLARALGVTGVGIGMQPIDRRVVIP